MVNALQSRNRKDGLKSFDPFSGKNVFMIIFLVLVLISSATRFWNTASLEGDSQALETAIPWKPHPDRDPATNEVLQGDSAYADSHGL